jgi:hypothetical protein
VRGMATRLRFDETGARITGPRKESSETFGD